MTGKNCILLVGLLWIFLVFPGNGKSINDATTNRLNQCFTKQTKHFITYDSFYGVIHAPSPWNYSNACTVFLKKNQTINGTLDQTWPQLDKENFLYISKRLMNLKLNLCVLLGSHCNATHINFTDSSPHFCYSGTTQCRVRRFLTDKVCQSSIYDTDYCNRTGLQVNDKYIINITDPNPTCISCDNPVKTPATKISLVVNVSVQGGHIDPVAAVNIMNGMTDLISSLNTSSAAVSVGKDITGVIVANQNPADIAEVSFAYGSSNSSINIIGSRNNLVDFSRSVTVPKEAFEKALNSSVKITFAAVFRFLNLAQDELNSTVLNNEVLAVEMGTNITNLTNTININFRNIQYNGIPSCHSWNGEGSRPNWTDGGCVTIINGSNITCQCSHLTFFAILMAPPNVTISSTDLNTLTIISQVGCGLSMFFLSIVLFMHFLMRRTKASKATRILIHLVSAMFLLNFTFLINNFVAKLENSVGCKIMGALMHYFMLATFTWFAVHAFHICLQLYTGGKIVIQRYVLKVSITSWVIPSIIGIILLIVGKYGEQIIYTDNAANNVAMCWITDSNVHYIVNIGYYGLVFLFTFTTFIIILSWLFCLKRTKGGTVKVSTNGKSIITILGLCCMLGVTWGFAFFAYGALMVPGYYIFTILNSFQGFFLFIYYYNTSHSAKSNADTSANRNSTSSTTTLKTSLDILENPYSNLPKKT